MAHTSPELAKCWAVFFVVSMPCGIPKLKEPDCNPMVVASVLRAVGDLCPVGGTIMKGYVDQLLPILLEFLSDASSSERVCSRWTGTSCASRA